MAECNQCGKVIYFSKNPAGKWVPFDKSGECHFVTCKGTPTKNSRKDLLNRIEELEEKLEKAESKASSYYHAYTRLEASHTESLAKFNHIQEYLYTPWQQVINTGKALARAHTKKTGKVRYHYKRFLRSVENLLAAEERATQAKRKR